MPIDVVGWDIGGAHLKAAALDGAGRVLALIQEACPLWQGLERLHAALDRVFGRLKPPPDCRHAVTMTGELADCFADREEGVVTLVTAMTRRCPPGSVSIFAGRDGFLAPDAVTPERIGAIASANWLASGLWTAAQLPEALFVDIGSTTTDIVPIRGHQVEHRGQSDHQRLRYAELVYTGIVRTPVMAVADRAPFDGEWVGVMAERFATMADVYRLTGELSEAMDQCSAADGGPKTPAGSRRRLARLLGLDAASAPPERWRRAAEFFRERQVETIRAGVEIQLSRGLLGDSAPFVGAGVGRFLVRELAERFKRSYRDFSDLFGMAMANSEFRAADCAPAAAVAALALRGRGRK